MAYWLKAAEDLFEVVDRKAKHVADELSEEQQIASQSSAFKGQEIQSKSSKSKNKARLKTSITELSRLETRKQDQKNDAVSMLYLETEEKLTLPSETMVDTVKDIRNEKNTEPSHDNDKVKISSTTTGKDDVNAANDVSGVDLVTSSLEVSDIALKKSEDKIEESSSQPSEEKVEILAMDHSSNPDAEGNLVNDNVSIKIDVNRAEVDMLEVNNMDAVEENGKETFPLPSSNLSSRKLYEHVTETPMKVQDELEEAQGLLKTSVSTGQSKEARLVRVCAGLSSRLQEYKSENAQLEELLIAERELCTSYQAHIKQLQKEVSAKRVEVSTAESNMAEALAAKNSEIETLMSSLDSLKKQASSSDLKLSSLQADMETIVRSRELSETRMLQALREELVSAEHRAEEERIAHSSTKMAAVEREVELEHRAVEASNALARIQRTAEEGASRIMELEHKIALLEVECGSLNQELQEMEARARRGQKKSNDEANQNLQVQAWQEEVERAHQGQRDADTKISSLEAELQKMRVEMAGMKRDAEHYSRHEHIELEKRYRELTDLLYHKQTQLETMVSQKAAAEFQLEKVIMRHQEIQEAERATSSRRGLSSWDEDAADLKALEPLPLHNRHMAAANMQLARAVKLLDYGTVRATRYLRRYPYARVILLFYLVFVHLFLMYLLHRLQEQADSLSAREVAESMGLNNSNLQ